LKDLQARGARGVDPLLEQVVLLNKCCLFH
jgi:hypothetical protein